MRIVSCGVSGCRPHKLPFEVNSHKMLCLLHEVETQVRNAISQGYTHFLSGGAMGSDIWFAEIVNSLKSEFPYIRLNFILPCETQANSWPEHWRERYFNILAKSDDVQYIQHHYSPDCMFRRNRALVDSSSMLIAVYDGTTKGGTAYTCNYAEKQGVPVTYIDPNKFMESND